ncbi:hypothetical protein D3C78_395170 [compost metagenome]
MAADYGCRAVQAQAGGSIRRLQVGRLQGGGERGIARGVALGNGEVLAVGLRGCQADAEQPVTADGGCAQFSALGIDHAHGRTHLALADEGAAAAVQGKLGGGIRRGAVLCNDGGRYRGFTAGCKACADLQGLGIELGVAEEHSEDAVAADRRGAQCGAAGGHGDQRAHGALASQKEAVGTDGQGGWCSDFGAVWPGHVDRGLVATVISYHYLHGIAGNQGWVDFDHEGAVWPGGCGAQVGGAVADDDGGAGFGRTADEAAIRADRDVGRRSGRGGIRRGDGRCARVVAGCVADHHGQALAIGERGIQRYAETAIAVHCNGDDSAIGVGHRDRAGPGCVAGHSGAVRADADIGRQCRRCEVRRSCLGCGRGVAGSIGEGDVEVLAIQLGRRQRHAEVAAHRHHDRAQ